MQSRYSWSQDKDKDSDDDVDVDVDVVDLEKRECYRLSRILAGGWLV